MPRTCRSTGFYLWGRCLHIDSPRRIDTIIKPYGYVLQRKKFVQIKADGTPSDTLPTPKAKGLKTPTTQDDEEKKPAAKSPVKKNGTTKKEKSLTKKAATPKTKKRKIEEVESEDVETEEAEEDEDDEATKMIKEKMGDGTDDEEGDEI